MKIKQILCFLLITSWPFFNAYAADNQWEIGCDQGTPQACQIQHQLATPENTLPAQILIYTVDALQILEYKVPLGLNLQKGVRLFIKGKNGKHAFPSALLTCHQNGCLGFTQINENLLTQLKKGRTLTLETTDYSTDKNQDFQFSLIGFTKTYQQFINR
ncbi:MAG: invasion associated locus B family protein [Arenicellales bacterium]